MASAEQAKPRLGYESQSKAIEALHIKGMTPAEIASLCECTKGTVYAAVAAFRKRTGIVIKHPSVAARRDALPRMNFIWETEEDRRRREIATKAARGARLALEAMGK